MEEKIFYNSTDNIKLCGLLSKCNNDNKIIILCHGIRGNKSERKSFDELTKSLSENNYNSFRFDFRAHGESTGKDYEMTITKEIEDLESTIKFLNTKGYDEFILLGASFGGSIISLLDYSKYNIEALIVWYGALDYKGTTVDLFSDEAKKIAEEEGFYKTFSNSGREFNFGNELFDEVYKILPYTELTKINKPILFVHGTGDTLIPYSLSEKVSALCIDSKLVLIENGEHTFDDSKESLEKAINETINFIKELKD